MAIKEAKRELYNKLKGKTGVTGAGITKLGNEQVIVIQLTKPKEQIKAAIPDTYEGYKVVTQQRQIARAMPVGKS
jgi:hypothetical protein